MVFSYRKKMAGSSVVLTNRVIANFSFFYIVTNLNRISPLLFRVWHLIN